MPIYWEQSVGGVQEVNFDIREDDEGYQIQKAQMKNDEFKEQIIDPTMDIVFIFNLQMNNNCTNAKFGMHKSIDDMSGISIQSTIVLT